jgi:hypothetical protein
VSQCQQSNTVLSFLDINGNRVLVTNGFWQGKFVEKQIHGTNAMGMILPGSDNIFSEVELKTETNTGWLPPELPPGCSNVTISLGSAFMVFPRAVAEISPEGAEFAIKDLPDFYLQNLDTTPGYSPRQKNMWLRSDGLSFSIAGRTIQIPVQPFIISNRLYVDVQIPFSNQKRKLVMNEDFDPQLPIPPKWDRNYSTNYFANNILSGGIYAYEVVNELMNPVLQVVYSAPNEVHINGIFQVESNGILAAFNQPPQLLILGTINIDTTNGTMTESLQSENFHETLTVSTNESIASFGQRLTNEFFRPIFKFQTPIFKYPSNRHLGEFAVPPIETNKSDSKIMVNP